MKEPPILSARSPGFPAAAPPAAPAAAVRRVRPFDACHASVVLRVLLLVEAVAGIAALFVQHRQDLGWAVGFAVLSGAMLPTTLGWLLTTCSAGALLARIPTPLQYAFGSALGALAGIVSCAVLATAVPWWVPAPSWLGAAAAGALVALLVMAGLSWRARGQNPAEVAARLAELQARIRPHFLFNTLNSAIALVRSDPARAETMLEDLAELFRSALVEQGPTVTLADELALARRYLAVEEVRFGERLKVEWALDSAADAALLPPLLLQPLVENAIVYSVECGAGEARLRISTERRPYTVIVRITNTIAAGLAGHGRSRSGHGIALANVRDRLLLLHDLQASFRAERQGDLFHVRIRLPA